LHVAVDATPGIERREFLQTYIEDETGPLRPGRFLDETTLFPVLQAFLAAPEASRITRATSQYEAALRNWHTGGLIMVLAHLYMAAEALAPAMERVRRERDGHKTAEAHAIALGVDTSQDNWKSMLMARVRRDYLFQGKADVYNAARAASDGLEHGFDDLPSIRAVAQDVSAEMFHLLRIAILDLLDLSDEVRQKVAARHPVDASALRKELRGTLVGAVADPRTLVADEIDYPHLAWTAAPKRLEFVGEHLEAELEDTLTHQFSDGVIFEPESHAVFVGLNPADAFHPISGSDEDTTT
jgi:hypothetical protein